MNKDKNLNRSKIEKQRSERKKLLLAKLIICICLAVIILIPQFFTTGGTVSPDAGTIKSLSDMSGKSFTVLASSGQELDVWQGYPNAKIEYCNDWSDLGMMLVQNKSDAFLAELSSLGEYLEQYPELTIIHDYYKLSDWRFILPKTPTGQKLQNEFNAFLAEINSDGTYDEIAKIWFDANLAPDHVDLPDVPTDPAGKVRAVTSLDWYPYCYQNGGRPCGLFVELISVFCARQGYELELEDTPVTNAVSGFESGKYDIMCYGVSYSEERAENVYYTDPVATEPVYIAINQEDYALPHTEKTISDFYAPGTKIAVLSDSDAEYMIQDHLPDCEIVTTDNFQELFSAVENGSVDAAVCYNGQDLNAAETHSNLAMIDVPIRPVNYGFATAKSENGNELNRKLNEFIKELKKNGTDIEIRNKYKGLYNTLSESSEENRSDFSGENGELVIATSGDNYPHSFFKGDQLDGYFIELANRFCKKYGYTPRYVIADLKDWVSGLNSGKFDMIADSVSSFSARQKLINITDTVMVDEMFLMVKAENETAAESTPVKLINNIVTGFEKNFIREERWKLILSGLWVSLMLSLLSGFFGTILGGIICAMSMMKNTFCRAFAQLYVKIIQGIPLLVSLMVLYYIIFGDSTLTAFWICVIGFSIDFAAYASEIFRTGISAIPEGQAKAARALGFSVSQTFRLVILPQAALNIIPVYIGQFITLIKMTSIAGYISVQDLTRVSDIIRSRTYDAFFPLLSTALIYFIMAHILTMGMSHAANRLDRRKMPKKPAGVNTEVYTIVTTSTDYNDEEKDHNKNNESPRTLLSVRNLKKSFDDVTPIENIGFDLNSGDVISIIGPSGTGKSTLLFLINRLILPDSGTIAFNGVETTDDRYSVDELRKHIGMVFQSFNLFSNMTVVENVMLAQVKLLKRNKQDAYSRSMELLKLVGLGDKAFNLPEELSGGQQQRIAIVRAIAMDPEILLFDEPTSALDPTMVGEVLSVIKHLAKSGMTMMIVTHEMQFAREVSSRVFYLDEGIIYEEGSPSDIFENPKRDNTRRFINHIKAFSFVLTHDDNNLINLLSDIDIFAYKNLIPGNTMKKLYVVLDELCIGMLLPATKNDIHFSFEYIASDEQILFTVVCDELIDNPLAEKNNLSVIILKNAVHEIYFDTANGQSIITGYIK